MQTEGWQADVEGDADAIFQLAGLDPDTSPTPAELCEAITGRAPEAICMRFEARHAMVRGVHRIFVNRSASPTRAKWLVGHELGEWYLRKTRYAGSDVELRANAIGSALCCARRPFKRLCNQYGHRVHRLAKAFGVQQGVALLRIGEVTGRPVVYICRHPVARGASWEWPATAEELRQAVQRPPSNVHPIRISDADRWGLMAKDWPAAA